MRSILMILAFGLLTNGLQAYGITMPGQEQRDNAQQLAIDQGGRIDELLNQLQNCRRDRQKCIEGCQ